MQLLLSVEHTSRQVMPRSVETVRRVGPALALGPQEPACSGPYSTLLQRQVVQVQVCSGRGCHSAELLARFERAEQPVRLQVTCRSAVAHFAELVVEREGSRSYPAGCEEIVG